MFSLFKKYPLLVTAFSCSFDGSMKLISNPVAEGEISRNRKAYFLKNNIEPEKVISAEIVHGNEVAITRERDVGKVISGVDGLITQNKDIYLSITSADCLPIFLLEPEKEIVGIIHAGWRSLARLESARQAENILFNTIEEIKKLGGAFENILIGIGPAICQKHYEVGSEIAEKFEKYPEAIRKEGEKIYLDLKKIAQLQLLEAGLQRNNIEINPECTFELSEKYFSARRDKKKEIEAMIAVIGLRG